MVFHVGRCGDILLNSDALNPLGRGSSRFGPCGTQPNSRTLHHEGDLLDNLHESSSPLPICSSSPLEITNRNNSTRAIFEPDYCYRLIDDQLCENSESKKNLSFGIYEATPKLKIYCNREESENYVSRFFSPSWLLDEKTSNFGGLLGFSSVLPQKSSPSCITIFEKTLCPDVIENRSISVKQGTLYADAKTMSEPQGYRFRNDFSLLESSPSRITFSEISDVQVLGLSVIFSRVKSNLSNCGLYHSSKTLCLDCGHVNYHVKYCGIRICSNPKCVNSRRDRIFKVLWEFHKRYISQRYSEPISLTLTLKGHRALSRENIDYVHECVSRFVRKFRLSGVVVFENKLKPDGFYFYHAHALLLNSYVDDETLRSAWLKITGDSFEINIHRVNSVASLKYLYQRSASPLDVSDKPLSSAIGIYVKYVYHRRYLSFFGLSEKLFSKTLRELALEVRKNRKFKCSKCGSSNVVLFDYLMFMLDEFGGLEAQPFVQLSGSSLKNLC